MAAWGDALAAYLQEQLPAAQEVRIVRAGPMPAGASNQTIALDVAIVCDGVEVSLPLVLRPERQGGILAPYYVGRQYRVLRALVRTPVPVPVAAWYEPTGAVLGVPFFLMHRLRAETPPLTWYGRTGERLLDAARALHAIHAVDWRAAGLEFLLPEGCDPARLPSPIACELPAWRARAARTGAGRLPLLGALDRYLVDHEPPDARHALLHGDTNAGNYLFAGERCVAVVDWELAAIGDPRSDLGFYAALSELFGGSYAGDGGESVLSAAYAQVTGESLSDLAYYAAFGYYRMLVVMAGWGGLYAASAIAARLDELLGRGWAA